MLVRHLLLVLGCCLLGTIRPVWGQHLLAHYPFDGMASPDASGNRNHGIWHGGLAATTDRFGRACSALHFNGLDAWVEVPSSPTLQSPARQLTVTAWCRLDPVPATERRWLTLVCKGDGPTETDANPHYRVQVLQAPAIQQSTVSLNSEFTEYDDNFAQHPFPTGRWFFFALTYDGSAVRTYQDGAEVFSYPYQGPLVSNDLPLFIGRDAPGALEFFAGSLDELHLYDAALSGTQLRQLYQAPASTAPVADLVLECPARRVVSAAPGQCTAVVTFPLPAASVSCGNVTVRQLSGLHSGEAFPVGNTTLSFQAESSDGQKKTCYTSIRVEDRESPQLRCQPDTAATVSPADPTGLAWHYALPTATDNCPGTIVRLVGGVPSGSRVPLGRSELRFVATDRQGNTAECSRAIVVRAPAAPVVTAALKPSNPVPPRGLAAPQLIVRRDSIKLGPTLAFTQHVVTVLAYDGQDEDGDSISIFFNKKEVVTKRLIEHRTHHPIIYALLLTPGEASSFVVKAWNIGRPGTPNTLTVEFFEGYYTEQDAKKLLRQKPMHKHIMNSLPGLSDSITLTCRN